jgi:hypothetical protein
MEGMESKVPSSPEEDAYWAERERFLHQHPEFGHTQEIPTQ